MAAGRAAGVPRQQLDDRLEQRGSALRATRLLQARRFPALARAQSVLIMTDFITPYHAPSSL